MFKYYRLRLLCGRIYGVQVQPPNQLDPVIKSYKCIEIGLRQKPMENSSRNPNTPGFFSGYTPADDINPYSLTTTFITLLSLVGVCLILVGLDGTGLAIGWDNQIGIFICPTC